MVLLSGIRHTGSFAGSLNALASTSLRLLVLWSNLLQFGQSSHWLSHVVGLFISWMSVMLFFTTLCLKEDSTHPDYVCRLNRSLYGLKQAPRAWYNRFASHLLQLGFIEVKQIRPCLSITRVQTWPTFFCMWMILCLLPPPCQHYDESSVPSSKNFL